MERRLRYDAPMSEWRCSRRGTKEELAIARTRLLELQSRLCDLDMTMAEWELVMAAYRVAELQWRMVLGFDAEMPEWMARGAGEGEAVH